MRGKIRAKCHPLILTHFKSEKLRLAFGGQDLSGVGMLFFVLKIVLLKHPHRKRESEICPSLYDQYDLKLLISGSESFVRIASKANISTANDRTRIGWRN